MSKTRTFSLFFVIVLTFGISNVTSNTNNRVNIKLTVGKKEYSDEFNKPAPLSAAPKLVTGTVNGSKSDVMLIPIRDLKNFFDIDQLTWDKNDKSLTIYREKPLMIFNNSDVSSTTTVVNELKRLISESKKSIDIEMYRLQEMSIIQELVKSGKKHIKIRIILDKSGDNCRRGLIDKGKTIEQTLESAGCDVRWKKCDKIMHRKIAVFDSETFYIGSGNWTDFGLGSDLKKGKNWELNMIWRNREYAGAIVDDFNTVWSDDSACLDKTYDCK